MLLFPKIIFTVCVCVCELLVSSGVDFLSTVEGIFFGPTWLESFESCKFISFLSHFMKRSPKQRLRKW